MQISIALIIVGSLLMLVAVGVPTYIISRYAKRIAPALTREGVASDFGGLLYLFVAGEVGYLITSLWQAGRMAGDLYVLMSTSSGALAGAALAAVPSMLAVLLTAFLLWKIAVGRTPRAAAIAVILLWLSGPCVAAAQSWYMQMALDEWSMLRGFGWCLFWTIYLAAATRPALIYGTARGRSIAAGR